jgi:RHS repeat-associated protein
VGISGPGVNASFVYDGLGRREKKTINGNLTEFLYDRLNPVQETSGATVLANILPGLGIDEFLTRTDVVAGVTSNFLTDALGSPVAVTDATGIIQTDYTYEPFGHTNFAGALNSSSYQYTGRENDGTGLYYYRARYYHPEFHRFVGEDPLLHPAFRSCPSAGVALRSTTLRVAAANRPEILDLYGYAGNNPIKFRDPLGLDKEPPCREGSFLDCSVNCYTERIPVYGDLACAFMTALCIASGGANFTACAAAVACGVEQTITVITCVQECRNVPTCQ